MSKRPTTIPVVGAAPSTSRTALETLGHIRAPYIPSSFGENFEAVQRDVLVNSMSTSADMLLSDAYDNYIETIEAQTGKRLENPWTNPHAFASPDELERSKQQAAKGFMAPGNRLSRSEAETRFFGQARELKAQHPTAVFDLRSPEIVREQIGVLRADVRSEAARVTGRADFGGTLGTFAGGAAMASVDPPVLASMLLAAPAAAGVLRTALFEAGIGGISEAAVQSIVQEQREQFGETADFAEAMRAALFATFGGALFGGALRAGQRALERLSELASRSGEVRAAAQTVVENARTRANNPLEDTLAAQREHMERSVAADERLRDLESPRPPDEPRARAKPHIRLKTKKSDVVPDDLAVAAQTRNSAADAFDVGQKLRELEQNARVDVRSEVTLERLDQIQRNVQDLERQELIAVFGEAEGRRIADLPESRQLAEIERLEPEEGFSAEQRTILFGAGTEGRLEREDVRALREAVSDTVELDRLSDDELNKAMSQATARTNAQRLRNVAESGTGTVEDMAAFIRLRAIARELQRRGISLADAMVAGAQGRGLEQADAEVLAQSFLHEGPRTQAPSGDVSQPQAVARVRNVLDEPVQKSLDEVEAADGVRELEALLEEDPNATIVVGEGDDLVEVSVRELLDDIQADEAIAQAVSGCTGVS